MTIKTNGFVDGIIQHKVCLAFNHIIRADQGVLQLLLIKRKALCQASCNGNIYAMLNLLNNVALWRWCFKRLLHCHCRALIICSSFFFFKVGLEIHCVWDQSTLLVVDPIVPPPSSSWGLRVYICRFSCVMVDANHDPLCNNWPMPFVKQCASTPPHPCDWSTMLRSLFYTKCVHNGTFSSIMRHQTPSPCCCCCCAILNKFCVTMTWLAWMS